MTEVALGQRDIELATGAIFVDVHRCSANHLPNNLFILCAEQSSSNEHDGWVLASAWQADEADVAMGEARKVGAVSEVSLVGILFCPFCGMQLNQESCSRP